MAYFPISNPPNFLSQVADQSIALRSTQSYQWQTLNPLTSTCSEEFRIKANFNLFLVILADKLEPLFLTLQHFLQRPSLIKLLFSLQEIPAIGPQMSIFLRNKGKCIGPCESTDVLYSFIGWHEVFALMFICPWKDVRGQISFEQFGAKSIQDLSHYRSIQSYLMNMKKKKFKEKQTFAELVVKEDVDYPLLYVERHTLYPERLFLVKSEEFRGFIRKISRHLSALLSLNNAEFFSLLEKNLTIRTSLESCLATFPRRAYGRLRDSRTIPNDSKNFLDKSYIEYAYLMKIVLFIFYRISTASSEEHKDLVYNEFLLDIPKLLDIAAIYGQSNPIITQKLIENAYKISPAYDNDTIDFMNSVEHGRLEDLQRINSMDIDFTPESLNAENYGNRQKFMSQNVVLTVFMIKDMLFNLINFMKYFPRNYVNELATDYKIQERLMDGVTYVMHLINKEWKLGAYRQRFSLHFEDLRQTIAIYFIQEFKILQSILDGKEKQSNQLKELAHNTYETFCLLLKSTKKPYHKEYVKIINNLIEANEDILFFISGYQIFNAVEKTETAVDFCQKYEKNYRRNHKIGGVVDFDPILNKNRDNMKKFKEIWISSEERKRQEFAKEREMKYKKVEDYELNAFLNKLKYGGKSVEYDDEPEQGEFHQIRLPNQYEQLDDKKEDDSFVIKNKKKYVEKGSFSSQNKEITDLSFRFKKAQKISQDLSFTEIHQNENYQDNAKIQEISFIVPKEDPFDSISVIQKDMDFSREQFEQSFQMQLNSFIWNDSQNDGIAEFSRFAQQVQRKISKHVDLSFI